MARVRIKQLGDRVATTGLHLGGGPERRKLEPGEVIDIPEDFYLPDNRSLLDVVWETGKVELTRDEPTRPLDYANYKEGRFCGPNFKPRDAAEEREMDIARQSVRERLRAVEIAVEVKEPPKPVKPAKTVTKSANPRARRRARSTAKHGTKAVT